MNNLMLDLETMGTKPGCVILSIGAVEFDLDSGKTGNKFYSSIELTSCLEAGLTTEKSTIDWWKEQPEQARNKAFAGEKTLLQALQLFTAFYKESSCTKIWGNSASFDCSILRACYDAVQQPVPWSFWNERCFRTVKGLFPNNIRAKDATLAHDPIYDCEYQIKVLCNIWRKLTTGNRI